MCLAIYAPKGVTVKKDWLKNGFESNNQGAGFASAIGGKIVFKKGFFTFDSFFEAFEPFQGRASVIHFRLATHGDIGESNCHPFSICNGRFAMVHNGVLPIEPECGKSDTATFAELVMEPMLACGVKPCYPAFQFLVEQAIGGHNKLALLNTDGTCTIFNESRGQWDKGAWFSNECYKRSFARSFFPDWPEDEEDYLYGHSSRKEWKRDIDLNIWS